MSTFKKLLFAVMALVMIAGVAGCKAKPARMFTGQCN
jgi:uncharacterized lipoprotein YehR (DUF1307 family)